MTKEKPILFSAPMVRALLDGSKTQTRRVVKRQPTNGWAFDGSYGRITSTHSKQGKFGAFLRRGLGTDFPEADIEVCPYGMPGDRVWVRETHAQVFEIDIPAGRAAGPMGTAGSPARPDWKNRYVYLADGPMPNVQWHHVGDSQPVRWTPSIHMPRAASRILLEIVSVRVERLNSISEADALTEGVLKFSENFMKGLPAWTGFEGAFPRPDAYTAFYDLWEKINGAGSWDVNPWVWVVEFKKV